MTTPRRVQMTRHEPWRVHSPGAVIVARPSVWGNPYRVGDVDPFTGATIQDRAQAVAVFVRANGSWPVWAPIARRELRGRDLACWCPLDEACHADVLLCIANHAPMCGCWGRPNGDTPTALNAASTAGGSQAATLSGSTTAPAGVEMGLDPSREHPETPVPEMGRAGERFVAVALHPAQSDVGGRPV